MGLILSVSITNMSASLHDDTTGSPLFLFSLPAKTHFWPSGLHIKLFESCFDKLVREGHLCKLVKSCLHLFLVPPMDLVRTVAYLHLCLSFGYSCIAIILALLMLSG